MEVVRKETGKEMQTGITSTDVRLRGWMLFVARALWLACALIELILFTINLLQPLFGRQTFLCPLTFTCPYDATTLQALQHAQIPLAAYTTYVTGFGLLSALIFVGLSVLIFWRMFDQLAGLFASFGFLFIGSAALVGDLSRMPLAIQVFQAECLVFCLGFFLVTFPDGRFVPRWSWLIGCTLFVQSIFFQIPGRFNILSWPVPLFLLELVLAYGSPVALQIYRYRRVSTPAQRQQTKWVIFGLICFILLFLLTLFAGGLVPTTSVPGALYQLASTSVLELALLLIPLSVTMGILRSRLWDIDIVINRTLVYGLLTATLLVIYLVLVFAGQALLSSLLGHNSGVVLVGSTLIVAALFRPLRHRIQQLIDRRFFRRKYNAQQTLAAFSSTLRGAVELDQVREQLLVVVQETMQPASLSLWIRPVKRQAAGGRTSRESLSRGGERPSGDRSDSR
jgi:hypothetical protein